MKRIRDEFERQRKKYEFQSEIVGISGDWEVGLEVGVELSGDRCSMGESFGGGIQKNVEWGLGGMNVEVGVCVVGERC